MRHYLERMEEGCFYHVYNRGNNGSRIFFQPRNYFYFLNQLHAYCYGYIDVHAYCLLPNHFHLLVHTKGIDQAKEKSQVKKGDKLLLELSEIYSELFRRFFLSYSKSIQRQQILTGSLLQKNFKRIKVAEESYLCRLVNYIHRNPQTHGFTDDYRKWPYSSYLDSLNNKENTRFKEMIRWFGTDEDFIHYHEVNPIRKDEEAGVWLE